MEQIEYYAKYFEQITGTVLEVLKYLGSYETLINIPDSVFIANGAAKRVIFVNFRVPQD